MIKKLLCIISAIALLYILPTLTQAEQFVRGLPLSKSIMEVNDQVVDFSTSFSAPYRQLLKEELKSGNYVIVLMKDVRNSSGDKDKVCISLTNVTNDAESNFKPKCIGSDEVSMIKIDVTSTYRINYTANSRFDNPISFTGTLITVK